ncbi:MAG: putative 4-hydroxybenzoate polyprenyltransferase [Prevotellaceae bacterium]|jgi:4-hydroxybenzoate polyprenyltransferase|nr:putative 4-hydroxybenzoate polyprenyltransferase [Prevotellaceae bacterium]
MKADSLKNYMSLVKFEHTVFALPFACIGFFLGYYEHAELSFDWILLLRMLLCMVFARNTAMAFNRYADRKIDEKNPRTVLREIPAKIISPKATLIFVVINCILFCITAFFINNLAFYLSPLALFVVLFYSYTKRFTAICHFVLGAALAIAPTGAYIAVCADVSVTPILLSAAVLLWTAGFDIIYALQDEDFDKSQSLKSIPAFMGRRKAMILSSFLHFIVIILLVIIYFHGKFGIFYMSGSIIFSAMLAYQHLIIKPNDLRRINAAFFTVNGVASVVYGIFFIFELLHNAHLN